MSVLRYIARLLLLIALLHLPVLQMEAGPWGAASAWASDDDGGDDGDGGDDDGGDDGGDDGDGGGSDDHGGGDDHGDDDGDHGGGNDDQGRRGGYAGGGYHDDDDDDDDDDDAEHARHARKKGKLLPLWVVMRVAKRKVPGKVLSVKLHRSGGRYYYHFRILDRRNHVRNLRLPASGRLKIQNWSSGR